MTDEPREVHELSLMELLQAVQRKTMADPIPPDQQWHLLHVSALILQACAQGAVQPLPSRDLRDIRGQEHVKRGLEVAAAGGHNILLIGPPGAGKRLLAQALPSILPHTHVPIPFRAPHFRCDRAVFVEELLLAHGGVLFLEDLIFFDVPQLLALQQAVQTHRIAMSEGLVLPIQFLLIATMRPCSCGFFGDPVKECTCSLEELSQYFRRREQVCEACFDLSIEVPVIRESLTRMRQGEGSVAVRQRIEAAREQQQKQYAQTSDLWVNAHISTVDEVQQYGQVNPPAENFLEAARQQLYFTPGQVIQTQKVARTIADLAEAEVIASNHLAEAIQYRPKTGR